MQNNYQKYLILILLLSLSACSTTYGQVSENNFKDVFIGSVDDEGQQILFYSRAIWYPNKDGFKFLSVVKNRAKT